MNMGNAGLLYCDSLVEDGYDNWVVATFEELSYVAGGGGIVPGVRTGNALYTRTPHPNYQYHYITLQLNNGYRNILYNNGTFRCVRHAQVTVSSGGGSSSSGGSSTPSTLGNGMPTMISNESANKMVFGNCVLYCDSLDELGHSDWIMPTIDQLTYATSGGCVIPDIRSSDYIWSRSFGQYEDAIIYKLIPPTLGDGSDQSVNRRTDNPNNFGSTSYQPKCRCVR